MVNTTSTMSAIVLHCFFDHDFHARVQFVSLMFWASPGDRCHPLFPPVRAFIFIVHTVQDYHKPSIESIFANSRSRTFGLTVL